LIGAAIHVAIFSLLPASMQLNKETTVSNVSDRKRLIAFLLCFFLGGLGVHRFYVGKVGTGILTIVTIAGFLGIWPLIDMIMILVGSFKDKEGNVLEDWT
jgi:TM2 domain-containing membrane protein YozV